MFYVYDKDSERYFGNNRGLEEPKSRFIYATYYETEQAAKEACDSLQKVYPHAVVKFVAE